METIARILSPSSASWVTWVLLSLLVIVVFNRSVLFSISTMWHSLLSYSDRMYMGVRAQSVMNIALSVIFRVGVMAMCVYVLCYESGDFIMINYLYLLAILGLMFLAQWLMWQLVSYTFLSSAQKENVGEQRTIIYNAACVILLLFLLVMIHFSSVLLRWILVGVFLVLLIGMMLFRGIQLFNQKSWKGLYIILYIITLELLPLVGITMWAKQLI